MVFVLIILLIVFILVGKLVNLLEFIELWHGVSPRIPCVYLEPFQAFRDARVKALIVLSCSDSAGCGKGRARPATLLRGIRPRGPRRQRLRDRLPPARFPPRSRTAKRTSTPAPPR